MSNRLEYQVSESAKADRKYFTNYRDALALAKTLSKRQSWPVFIDVYDNSTGELADYWYTVTKGKLVKHVDKAGIK